jgi:hypothetical protein
MTTHLPAETLQISPEALEVANCYLQLNDVKQVAHELDLKPDQVSQILGRREVKQYIDGVGSSKDIADLLQMSHKMSMDLLDKQLQLEKLRQGTPGPQKQVNVQINDDGSKYSQLIHKLVSGDGI